MLPLRHFQVVARHENVSAAAEELRVAQPSLSRTVARLEAELGVPLFDRTGRRIRLNRYGAAFLRRVDRALGELDDARRELADAAGLAHGEVTVAAETVLTLTGLLRGFRARWPGVTIRLRQLDAAAMVPALRASEVDLCLASQPLHDPALESRTLLTEDVLLAVAPDHRLADRASVSVAELAGEPIVTNRPGYWQRELTERLFARAGVQPDIVCEGNEPGATQDLIGAGLGVGLVPAMSRAADSRAPVVWLRVEDPACTRTLTAVWHRDTYLSVAAQRFRDAAAEHFMSSEA